MSIHSLLVHVEPVLSSEEVRVSAFQSHRESRYGECGRVFDEEVDVTVELDQTSTQIGADFSHDVLAASEDLVGKCFASILRDEHHVDVQRGD